jgi:hypothetical protein
VVQRVTLPYVVQRVVVVVVVSVQRVTFPYVVQRILACAALAEITVAAMIIAVMIFMSFSPVWSGP